MPIVSRMTDRDTHSEERMLSIGEFARRAGVTVATVRNWDKSRGGVQSIRTPGGQRRFPESQLIALIGERAS